MEATGEGPWSPSKTAAADTPQRAGRPVGHAYNEERSIWLHRAIARHVVVSPDAVRARALANISRARAVHGRGVEPYLTRWEALLEGPLDDLLAMMESRGQEARDLRQCTPFSGILTPKERWDLYRAYRQWWEGQP